MTKGTAQTTGAFLTDVKELRRRARVHMERGAVTDGYEADRKIVLAVVVVGVLLWLLNNYVPMDRKIKSIVNVVVVIVVVIWVLQAVGPLGSFQDIRIR
jgi:hypothetical protein